MTLKCNPKGSYDVEIDEIMTDKNDKMYKSIESSSVC